uniref:hypothetical protein n=1 Tax=Alistipes sp. TaxID=1872444 RepID=UPI004056B41F
MDLKLKLQRMLQILEESERAGVLADLERDIILNDLREVYAELKYSDKSQECEINTPTASTTPTAPATPTEEVESEPEVEVELIFDEESEEAENEEQKTENEEQEEQIPIVPIIPTTPIEELSKESVEPNEELSSLVSRSSSNKRSALLSLYEDAPTPVVGEQFHDKASVADTIACPKGVAESAPVASLREAIGVADKFMLIRELFDGDAEVYETAIDALEKQPSFDDCIIFIAEHYTWSPNSQATKLVMDLLQRKYN